MSNYQIVKNCTDGKSYFISIVPTHKKIAIPGLPEKPEYKEYKGMFPPIIFEHLIFEAAIYANRPKILSKPILVIHIDDGLKNHISESEFTKLIHSLVMNEEIINLYDEISSSRTFAKYNYTSVRYDIWSIWFWQKIKHIFLFK